MMSHDTSINFSVRGNIAPEDRELLHAELQHFLSQRNIEVTASQQHLAADYLEIGSQIIASSAAFLYVCIEAHKLLSKPNFTYDDLLSHVRTVMAKRGYTQVPLIKLENFPSNGLTHLTQPCVLTLRDLQSAKSYKLYIFNASEESVLEIEISAFHS